MSWHIDNTPPADRVLGGFREWSPPPPFNVVCEAVWTYESGHSPIDHRLLPDGKPSLVLRLQRDAKGDVLSSSVIVSGGLSHAGWYRPGAYESQIGLRLFPEACQEFDLFDPRDYVNGSGPAPSHLKRAFDRLAGEMPDQDGRQTGLKMLQQLMTQARPARRTLERFAGHSIRRAGGQVCMTELAESAGISDRQLRRQFIGTTGLSPKQYARMVRHLRAIMMAEDSGDPDWAGIAAECGYTDQSHLIRDTKSLTGISPAVLLGERRAESEMSNTQEGETRI